MGTGTWEADKEKDGIRNQKKERDGDGGGGGAGRQRQTPPPIARPRRAATMETMEMLLLGLQPGEQWS